MISRRHLLTTALAAPAVLALPQASARAATARLRIGYLHGLASDSHLWVAQAIGAFADESLDIETIQFVSGLEAYQALVGGSLDVVTTGAVISNFPARGQGKAFLPNAIEVAEEQLWVQPDAGISRVADLKGRQVVTARGTSAHYFLHKALQAAGLDSTRDVEVIHQPMGNAVTTFVAGAAPAVATWVPFDTVISQGRPQARLLIDAGQVPDSAIVNGWSARNALFDSQPDLLKRLIRAWARANDVLTATPERALGLIGPSKWPQYSLAELRRQYDLARWYPTRDWVELIRTQEITRLLDRVTRFNVDVGAFSDPLPASRYFDPSLFLSATA